MKKTRDLFWTFLKIGAFTFGGGYAMVALLEREFVEDKQWLSREEFLDMVAIAESTPGPVAVNSATYIGYKLAGVAGAAASTLAVCLPSFAVIYLISLFFDRFLQLTVVANAFKGIQACVIYLILSAGVKMLKNLQRTPFNTAVVAVVLAAMVGCSVLAVKFSSICCILLCGAAGVLTYAVCGIALILGALLLSQVPVRFASPKIGIDGQTTMWQRFAEGLHFMRTRPIILGTISLDLFAVLLGGATALLPIYAKDILHTGPWGLGVLRAAPAIGALAMGAWLARYPVRRQVGRAMFAAVAVFGLATIAFGVSRWLPLSFAALTVLGAADMISVVIRGSFVQLETPDEMRGRVSAVNSLFIGASNQLGEFESGIVAAALGPVWSVISGGIGTLVVVALWMRWFPQLARQDRMPGC